MKTGIYRNLTRTWTCASCGCVFKRQADFTRTGKRTVACYSCRSYDTTPDRRLDLPWPS